MTATVIEEIKDIIATVIAAKLESAIVLFQYMIIYSFFLIIGDISEEFTVFPLIFKNTFKKYAD